MAKARLVGSLAAYDLWTKKESILAVSALTIPQAAAFTAQITLAICLKISIALLLLALLDYFYQWQQIESQLRMTKEEMKEEMKSSEGDPLSAARRKLIQKQLAKNRLKAAVPKPTLAITNPTELAIAIRYDIETMPAPIVVAKGAGVLAQQIRRLCLEHNIPLVERKELARALYDSVEVNKPIPLEHYAAVAEVLSYVYQLKGWKAPQRRAAA